MFFFILQNKNPWAHFYVQVIIIATLLLCMNHPVWCIWCLQQNQQPPLGFFHKKQLVFQGTAPESNGSLSGSLPKYLLSHTSNLSLCLLHNNKRKDSFLFKLHYYYDCDCSCVSLHINLMSQFFQAKRKAAEFSRVFTTNACKLLPKKSCTFQQASCFHLMDEPANVLNCCIFTCAWFIH